MKLVYNNTSIECAGAAIKARKLNRTSVFRINGIGVCLVYKSSRNSQATIMKELDPKKAYYNTHSALNIDDIVQAEDLTIYIHSVRCIIAENLKKSKGSGKHNAQFYDTKSYTAAVVCKQIPGIPPADPLKQLEAVKTDLLANVSNDNK